MRRLLRFTGHTLTLVAFLMCLAVGVMTAKGWRMVPILSGSMRPGLAPADLALTRPLPVMDIKTGDVIAFKAPIPGNPLVIHRVIDTRVEGDEMIIHTKGDANNKADDFETHFSNGQVLQSVESVRSVGRVVHYIAMVQPTYMALLVVLIFGAITAISLIATDRFCKASNQYVQSVASCITSQWCNPPTWPCSLF